MIADSVLKKTLLVIPSINGGSLLERMLPTLGVPSEIVVVLDQGSTDNSEAVCQKANVQLVQLGQPHTYTRACNIGASLARERGCEYLFVANNDITFTTDVVRELLEELIADPRLGIVAPAQMIIDEVAHHRELAYRAYWDLDNLTFAHDFTAPSGSAERLESDFCELTFAGVRMSVIDEVGFLDDDYGFYHEDADFGFRLRQAGYSCAYLPRSQIEHWTSSTMSAKPSEFKANYISKNKNLFSKKNLTNGVFHQDHKSNASDSWNIINKNLHPALRLNGLLHAECPELIFSHPGTKPFDVLYTVWETSKLPASWLEYRERYKLVLTTSQWGTEVLKEAGFGRVHYAPLGVDSDVYQPWGTRERFTDGRTFLWFSRNQYRKGLDVMLAAWRPFHAERPDARLILMGTGILDAMPLPNRRRVWKKIQIAEYPELGISVFEVLSPLDESELATIYRSVDYTVCSSRAEGFGFSVAESLASGTPSIFANFSSTTDFITPNALVFEGKPSAADYSDKGFADVGHWWEPSVPTLTRRLFEAADMNQQDYRQLASDGVRLIRNKFSWRNTSFAIRNALIIENEGHLEEPRKVKLSAVPKTDAFEDDANVNSTYSTTTEIETYQPSFVTRVIARAIARFGNLSSYFGAMLENHGWSAALSSSWNQYIKPYSTRRATYISEMAGRYTIKLAKVMPRQLEKDQAAYSLRKDVLFIGYAEGALGLGQAFRANLMAAATTDLKFAVYPFQKNIETRLIGPFMPERYDTSNAYQVNVLEMAADQVPEVFATLDPQLLSGSYNVLCTYWELPSAPEAWRSSLTGIDEIWAPNQFIADAFTSIFDGPIVVMPPAMENTDGNYPGRDHYEMERDRLYFLFSFDYYSSPFRKNPMGVLKAFQKAFPLGTEPVGLVIKSTGAADHYPEMKAAILEATNRDRRILVFDRDMEREEMLGLIQAADVYVSLHRAEGFGLGMAEAMTFGRTVMGTNYSGCVDFLKPETGYPVPYKLRSVEEHEYPWSYGQSWAEPDEDAAVELMRHIVEHREEGQERGVAAKNFVHDHYTPAVVGVLMEDRIRKIQSELGSTVRVNHMTNPSNNELS